MRSGHPNATTHPLRVVAGGFGAVGFPQLEQEKEAEEVRVRGAWGERVPGWSPRVPLSRRLRRLLVCTRCQVAAALRFAAGTRGAEWGPSPAPRAPAAPHASWPGAGSRRGQVAGPGSGPGSRASQASPTPAAPPPPLATTPGRSGRSSPRGTCGLRVPWWDQP